MNKRMDDYMIGYNQGKKEGIEMGYQTAFEDLEPRIAKMWAEIQTLNARIDYLNKVLEGENHG